MYCYTAYGLGIHSELPLPELLLNHEANKDVLIKLQKLKNSPLKTDSVEHCFQLTPEGMYIFWENIGTILIREGKEIIIDSVLEAEESRIRLFILGAAIGVILHQRGFLVLHASAVVMNGNAVAFVGDKGRGKSTMAAALNARGHNLIGDDVIALD
ncbi:MAG: serine kinase, partial [Rivularia sp. (in: cyanobacteria)]